MIAWTLLLLIIAILAGIFGFSVATGVTAFLIKLVLFLSLVLFVLIGDYSPADPAQ